MTKLKCSNCTKEIKPGQKYKLEIPMNNPLCKKCWPQYERWLNKIDATTDLSNWNTQEILTRN